MNPPFVPIILNHYIINKYINTGEQINSNLNIQSNGLFLFSRNPTTETKINEEGDKCDEKNSEFKCDELDSEEKKELDHCSEESCDEIFYTLLNLYQKEENIKSEWNILHDNDL
jgi:hypothetical protein